jgi:hypothetical protein
MGKGEHYLSELHYVQATYVTTLDLCYRIISFILFRIYRLT